MTDDPTRHDRAIATERRPRSRRRAEPPTRRAGRRGRTRRRRRRRGARRRPPRAARRGGRAAPAGRSALGVAGARRRGRHRRGRCCSAAGPRPEAPDVHPRRRVVVHRAPARPARRPAQKLANFLAQFPGFADQSTLPTKIDEVLGRLVRRVHGGSVDYASRHQAVVRRPGLRRRSLPAPTRTPSRRRPAAHRLADDDRRGRRARRLVDGRRRRTRPHATSTSSLGRTAAMLGLRASTARPGRCSATRRRSEAAIDAQADGSGIDTRRDLPGGPRHARRRQLATVYVDGEATRDCIDGRWPSPATPGRCPTRRAARRRSRTGSSRRPRRGRRARRRCRRRAARRRPPTRRARRSCRPAGARQPLAAARPGRHARLVEGQGRGVGAARTLLAQFRAIPMSARSSSMLDLLGGVDEPRRLDRGRGVAVIAGGRRRRRRARRRRDGRRGRRERVATAERTSSRSPVGSAAASPSATTTSTASTVTTVTITDLGALVPPGARRRRRRCRDGRSSSRSPSTDRSILLGVGDGFVTAVLDVAARRRPRGRRPATRPPTAARARRTADRGLRRDRATSSASSSRSCRPRPGPVRDGRQAVPRRRSTAFSLTTSTDGTSAPRPRAISPSRSSQPDRPSPATRRNRMAVRIRLTRVGATKQPSYRVVVADSPQRPRQPLDRDDRALQPAHRPDRARTSTPTRRRRGWPRAPSRPTPSPACSAAPASCPRTKCREGRPRSERQGAGRVRREVARRRPRGRQGTEVEDEEGTVIELHVAEDDMGKVIGRNGSVAKALRTLLKVTAAREGSRSSSRSSERATARGALRARPTAPRAWSSASFAGCTACAAPSGSRCSPTGPRRDSPSGAVLHRRGRRARR